MGVERNEHRKVPSVEGSDSVAPAVSKELVKWLSARLADHYTPRAWDSCPRTLDQQIATANGIVYKAGQYSVLDTLKALSERTPS